jgi:hypothetical protein
MTEEWGKKVFFPQTPIIYFRYLRAARAPLTATWTALAASALKRK